MVSSWRGATSRMARIACDSTTWSCTMSCQTPGSRGSCITAASFLSRLIMQPLIHTSRPRIHAFILQLILYSPPNITHGWMNGMVTGISLCIQFSIGPTAPNPQHCISNSPTDFGQEVSTAPQRYGRHDSDVFQAPSDHRGYRNIFSEWASGWARVWFIL